MRKKRKGVLRKFRTFLDFLFVEASATTGCALFANTRSVLGSSTVRSAMRATPPSALMGGFGNDAPGSNLGSLHKHVSATQSISRSFLSHCLFEEPKAGWGKNMRRERGNANSLDGSDTAVGGGLRQCRRGVAVLHPLFRLTQQPRNRFIRQLIVIVIVDMIKDCDGYSSRG
jgi:hypothetical protein